MSVLTVRLKDPAGQQFITDDWAVDEAGYVLRNVAAAARGASKPTAMHPGTVVRVPHSNVQYTTMESSE